MVRELERNEQFMAKRVGCADGAVVILGAIGLILFGMAGLLGTALFWALPFVVPEAELSRDADGLFIVTPDNYDDWMTYSAVFSNINGKVAYGRMNGDLRVRVVPRLQDTPPGRIANAGNYRSKFYTVTTEGADIVLVTRDDDNAISAYRTELLSAVRSHNDAVVAAGFDASIRLEKPRLDIDPVIEFGSWHKKQPWMNNCVSAGCRVAIKVEYSSTFFDGPNVPLVGAGLIISRL